MFSFPNRARSILITIVWIGGDGLMVRALQLFEPALFYP